MKGFTKWIGKYLPSFQQSELPSVHQTDQPGVRYYSGLEIKRLQDAAYQRGLLTVPADCTRFTNVELARQERERKVQAEHDRHYWLRKGQEMAWKEAQVLLGRYRCAQHDLPFIQNGVGAWVCPKQAEHSAVVRRRTPRPTTNLNAPVSHLSGKSEDEPTQVSLETLKKEGFLL